MNYPRVCLNIPNNLPPGIYDSKVTFKWENNSVFLTDAQITSSVYQVPKVESKPAWYLEVGLAIYFTLVAYLSYVLWRKIR